MAMSPETRKELGKLRELIWYFLSSPKPCNKCFFCKGSLLSKEQWKFLKEWVCFGNATAPPIDLPFTLHHKDGNHDNNRPVNLTPSHTSCHKSWEAKRVFRLWRAA